MTDTKDPLRELLERREAEQRGMHEAIFGRQQAPPESTGEPDADAPPPPPPTISFDGGARDPGPRQPPSMDGLIRAGREQRGRELFDRADQLDDGHPWR